MNNLIENDILIRNMDASYLYWKIKDDGAIAEYENKKKELSSTDNQEVQDRVQELSKQIFSFGTDIKLPEKDNRYLYSGTLTDSLMTRKLRQVVNNKDGAIRVRMVCLYLVRLKKYRGYMQPVHLRDMVLVLHREQQISWRSLSLPEKPMLTCHHCIMIDLRQKYRRHL